MVPPLNLVLLMLCWCDVNTRLQIKKQLNSGTLTTEQHATLVHQLEDIYEQRRRMGTSEIGDTSPRHDPPQPSNQTETVSMQWQATDQSMHSSGPSLNRLTQPTPSVHRPVHVTHRSNYMHPIRSGRGGPPPPRQSGPPRSRRYRPPRLRGEWGEEPPAKRHPWPDERPLRGEWGEEPPAKRHPWPDEIPVPCLRGEWEEEPPAKRHPWPEERSVPCLRGEWGEEPPAKRHPWPEERPVPCLRGEWEEEPPANRHPWPEERPVPERFLGPPQLPLPLPQPQQGKLLNHCYLCCESFEIWIIGYGA